MKTNNMNEASQVMATKQPKRIKIRPENRVPGWRILKRGERIRATDMQYTPLKGGYNLTEKDLLRCNCTGEAFKGDILGERNLADYRLEGSISNLFYRKLAK